jgi:hypothetical protein
MQGYKIHPSYIFWEEKTYLAASWLQEKLLFLNNWKLPAVVFVGKWFMFMPEDPMGYGHCCGVVSAATVDRETFARGHRSLA